MPIEEHRFDVFGRRLSVVRGAAGEAWQVYVLGADGKRGPAGVIVPAFVEADDLLQFLADLYHEHARPGLDDPRRLPRDAR